MKMVRSWPSDTAYYITQLTVLRLDSVSRNTPEKNPDYISIVRSPIVESDVSAYILIVAWISWQAGIVDLAIFLNIDECFSCTAM